MNAIETAKVMAVLKAAYPQYYKDTDEDEVKSGIALWQAIFSDHSYEAVSNAVMAFIATDTKGFPPAPGMIMDKLINLSHRHDLTEGDAWRYVRNAVANSRYNAEKEFKELPEIVQRAVGDYKTLKNWAEIPVDELDTVVASNFMRSFRARATSERDYMALPGNVKEFMKALAGEGVGLKRIGEDFKNGD
jgi:hypothetical protein